MCDDDGDRLRTAHVRVQWTRPIEFTFAIAEFAPFYSDATRAINATYVKDVRFPHSGVTVLSTFDGVE